MWYLVNLCIANAYIVYKDVSTRQTKANYDHMAFRLELAQELIAKFNGRKRAIQDRGGGVMLPHHNFYGHSLVRSESARPKRCRPHKKYRPIIKTEGNLFLCVMYVMKQCVQIVFRLAHVEMLNQ